MENQVILVQNKEHGKEVIKYWKSRGVDTNFKGTNTVADKGAFPYYGFINGYFDNYTLEQVKDANAEIIELPKPYPKVMMVSRNEKEWNKRVVFMKKNGKFLAWNGAETLQDAEKETYCIGWDFAKDIEEPQQTELTIEQIAEKFNLPVEQIRIKK